MPPQIRIIRIDSQVSLRTAAPIRSTRVPSRNRHSSSRARGHSPALPGKKCMRPATSGVVRLIHLVLFSPEPALNSLQTATARDPSYAGHWGISPAATLAPHPIAACGISRAKDSHAEYTGFSSKAGSLRSLRRHRHCPSSEDHSRRKTETPLVLLEVQSGVAGDPQGAKAESLSRKARSMNAIASVFEIRYAPWNRQAGNAPASKSPAGHPACGFDSLLRHQNPPTIRSGKLPELGANPEYCEDIPAQLLS